MAANLLGRYVWLVDIIRRHKRLTFKEIQKQWEMSGLSYGDGDSLALRTFHHHRDAIRDIFNIDIECDPADGYRYYIREPERLGGDALRNWLIDSYAALNQIQADNKMEGRIIFEDIPSGHLWLTAITDAMRRNKMILITHQGFGKPAPKVTKIEPYCLKLGSRRWYVLGHLPLTTTIEKGEFRTYALDRILHIEETDEDFTIREGFSPEEYFADCVGVFTNNTTQRIVIRAYGKLPDYLRTLPLHSSQKELGSEGASVLFEYRVKPTFDFYQQLLAQADQLEVLEPQPVRDEMRRYATKLTELYGE